MFWIHLKANESYLFLPEVVFQWSFLVDTFTFDGISMGLNLGFPVAKICGAIATQNRKNLLPLRGFFALFCVNLHQICAKLLRCKIAQNIICGRKFSPQNCLRSQNVCAVAIFFMDIEIMTSSLYSIIPANSSFDTKASVFTAAFLL